MSNIGSILIIKTKKSLKFRFDLTFKNKFLYDLFMGILITIIIKFVLG